MGSSTPRPLERGLGVVHLRDVQSLKGEKMKVYHNHGWPRWRWLVALAAAALMACGEDNAEQGEPQPELSEGYIRADRYTRLVIEVDYVEGNKPTPEVADELAAGLVEQLDKPAGVEVVYDQVLEPRGEDYGWSLDELFSLASATYNLDVSADTIRMHTLFVDGHDARDGEDGTSLGLAWSNRHMVIFKEKLAEVCEADAGETLRRQGLVEAACEETELAIWTHESGHVMGLVNYGVPMVEDHEDPEHPHHDRDEDCVMYWAFERRQAFENIGQRYVEEGSPELGFCPACLEDIAAVRD